MKKITALFWDVGGVLLTNGWDRAARRKLVEQFKLDWEDFEDRHELVNTAFETGQLGLGNYLERTIFYRHRDFTKREVQDFMMAQSQPYPETLAIAKRLADSKNYLLATVNNESTELNLYRIERFGLRNYFTVFFSSCYLGVRKPEEKIYRLALDLTQRDADESVFIDDRVLNVECARHLGIHAIEYEDPTQLQTELRSLSIEL